MHSLSGALSTESSRKKWIFSKRVQDQPLGQFELNHWQSENEGSGRLTMHKKCSYKLNSESVSLR